MGAVLVPTHSAEELELFEGQVTATRVQTLFAHTPQVLVANGVNAALVGVLLWDPDRASTIAAWWAAMALMVVGRLAMGRAFARRASVGTATAWLRRFTHASAVSGILWGIGTVALFRTGDLAAQVLLAFVVGGMGAGAASTIAGHRPAFAAYLLPSILPLMVRFAFEGDDVHLVMAAMGTLFGLLFLRIGRTTHDTLVESLRLRFSNEALVGRLVDARAELEQTNATLEERVQQQTEARTQAERQLQQAQKLEAVGRLTGGVAHDFNNHLTVIINCLDLLSDGPGDPAEDEALRRSARAAARRGADLTRKLLAFSRKQPLAPVRLDVGRTLEATIEQMVHRVLPESIRLRFSNHAPGVLARVDLSQLETAILNLALNARDAMPAGGELAIEVDRIDDRVCLTVRDQGTGIDPRLLDRVCDPFFTTKGDQGTGLGLSMVHGFASQSGGKLVIEPNHPHGTTVRIELPVAEGPGDVWVTSSPRDVEQRVRDGRREKLLLVEDDPDVLDATRKTLEALGYDVATAGSVAEALARLEERRFDLVVSDVVMPGGQGGLELAERAERRWPDLQFLLVTGHAEDLERLSRFPVLLKPYERAELATEIRTLLETR